jgi:hypothetical protein
MISYPKTGLSKIQLPIGFVEIENNNPFHLVFFDQSTMKLYLESGELSARFRDDYELLVITYGNQRRLGTPPKSEVHVDWSTTGMKKVSRLLCETVKHILQFSNLQDGHDAFIFTPMKIYTGRTQEFSSGIVKPLGHPGLGRFWYLLGVIEKT